jgi:hypothetical protein
VGVTRRSGRCDVVAHRCAMEGRVARGSGGQCRFRGGCYRGGPSLEVEGGQEGGGLSHR